jgi:hypothetical protein
MQTTGLTSGTRLTIRRKVMAGESPFDVGLLSKEFSENNNWY